MILDLLLFAAGIGLLIVGAWSLVTGGSKVAGLLGVPPIVIGLTVVAFGTSAPELFVSLMAALRGSTGLVLGNVVGSNVANLGLILALGAVIRPVRVERELTRREVPLLGAATLLFAGLIWDGTLSRGDALILVLGFGVFMFWTLRGGRESVVVPGPVPAPAAPPARRGLALAGGFGMVLVGVVALAGGGQLIVTSALGLAARLGVSETLIGLTLVAVGTSLPELATTVVAGLKAQDDLALGNIIGSNLFNILGVAGPVGLVRPLVQQDASGTTQVLSMILLTALVFAMLVVRGGNIGRARGALLLTVYVGVIITWTLQS